MLRHSTYVKVHLPILADNIKKIQRLAPKASLIPMVKGDAYGHGMIPVSNFLTEALAIKRLGVATFGEALTLIERNRVMHEAILSNRSSTKGVCDSGSNKHVIVFSDTELKLAGAPAAYQAHRNVIIPVIATLGDLSYFLKCDAFRTTPLYLKVNTGMNRMGITVEDLQRTVVPTLKKADRRVVQHLVQHFAVSGEAASAGDRTYRQLAVFHEAKAILEEGGIAVAETSVANSGAIEQGIGVDETYVRPGLMMYGPCSVTQPRRLWKGKQVGHFYTKVLNVFECKSGDFVGYGFNAVTEHCVVALLAMGYADGFLRYNNGLPITVNGLVGHVHGNVNMDMTAVVFYPSKLHMSSSKIRSRVRAEQSVLVWADDINDKAEFLKTNAYQLMCGLSVRVPRVYTHHMPHHAQKIRGLK